MSCSAHLFETLFTRHSQRFIQSFRTPPIEINNPEQKGTYCDLLSTYLSDGAREIIFGSKSADPTQQNAIRASAERRVSLLSVYVVSSNDDQLKTLYSVLSEIPCRIYVLKGDDFYTKEQGRYDGMGIDRLANLKAAGGYKGYPALVFDGGTASTYTAADENGNIMGGGIGPGVHVYLNSLSNYTYALPQLSLESVMNELASLTDKDGNVLKTLPVFARSTEENIVTRLCTDISRTGQFVIENFLHDVEGSKTNDSGIKCNTGRVILVTGGDAPLIARLLEPNSPLVKSLPNATTSSPPKYKVKAMKHMVHYGITSVLKENAEEFEQSASAELDTILIGQRIAKKFSTSDQDGDHIYRGCVACVRGDGSKFPYGIRYDDGDAEDMNALQLYGTFLPVSNALHSVHRWRFYNVSKSCAFSRHFVSTEAMGLYIQVGEKETHAGESSRESQPRQPPLGAKISGAKIAASKLAIKDKTVEEFVNGKKQAQSKTATSAAEPSSKAAASTQPTKDDTVKNPLAEGKKRPPKNKTPASGTEPPKQLAKKPKKARPGLKKADEDYVGDRVAKDFDGEVYFGTVREVWYDNETEEKLWQIKYDDSDEEDCGKDDFIGLLNLYEKEKQHDDKKGSK